MNGERSGDSKCMGRRLDKRATNAYEHIRFDTQRLLLESLQSFSLDRELVRAHPDKDQTIVKAKEGAITF